MKVESTQLYLYQESYTETLLLLISHTIKKNESAWPMEQELYLPPLLGLLQRAHDKCLILTVNVCYVSPSCAWRASVYPFTGHA